MHDNWGLMQQLPDLDQNYYYGVEYDYFDGNQSSGVAAYEPTIGKDENPFNRWCFNFRKDQFSISGYFNG